MKTVTPEEIEEQNAHVQELRRVRNLFPRYRTQKNLGIPMKTVTPEEIREEIDHAVKTCEPWILDVVEDAIWRQDSCADMELIIAHIIDRMALRDPTVEDGDYRYSRDGGFASIWFSGTDDSEIDRASLVLFATAQRQHHTQGE